jgi:hypothetical protein
MMIEMARQDEDVVEKFVSCIAEEDMRLRI